MISSPNANPSKASSSFETILSRPAVEVAPRLLGAILTREIDGHVIKARIVEVEAYDETDAASHSYKGRTPRTDIMFGPAGFLYVYFTYGMHYCCNVVTGKEGEGSAVLIRAVEPIEGRAYLETRRGKAGVEVTNGPAKLCQALGIDRTMNGHDLRNRPLMLTLTDPIDSRQVVVSRRIGISKDVDRLWRFHIKDTPFVSRA